MVASAQVQRNPESERAAGSEWRSVAGVSLKRKQKRPMQFVAASAFCFILAATYVPTQLPVQYHRPCGA